MAIAIVVDNVIGSGIFLKPAEIASAVGSFPLLIAAWVVGGIVCILGALCFAELAAMLPRAGGLYVYLREAYGRPVAFLFGWTEFLFGKPASTAALAVAFVVALNRATGLDLSLAESLVLALVLIAGMAWVNIMGVIWGGRVVATTMLIKAGFLAAIALLPFAMAAGGNTAVSTSNYLSTATPAQATLSGQFAAAMLAVMWAYNGWHGIAPVAEEVRDPGRNIPLALFGGVGLLMLLYVSANLAYHGVLSMDEMAEAGQNTAQTMMHKLLSPWGSGAAQAGVAAVSAIVMCSTFGAINVNLLSAPRVSFAMGRDDLFFRSLGRVHVNYRTPAVSIAVMALMAGSLLVGTALAVTWMDPVRNVEPSAAVAGADGQQTQTAPPPPAHVENIRTIFNRLTDFVVFSASIFYMLAVLAVIVLRVRRPEWQRPYRTLGYPVIPLAYLAFYTWFLSQAYAGSRFSANVGLGLVALGLPAYFAWRAWAARHPEDMSDGQ
jgi:basic amino acid/polyamine antiporter, APA family